MLLDIIFVPLIYIFNFFLNLFPIIEFDTSLMTGLISFFDMVSSLNRYLPINEIFSCLMIMFVVVNIQTVIYCANWILNKVLQLIPFIG